MVLEKKGFLITCIGLLLLSILRMLNLLPGYVGFIVLVFDVIACYWCLDPVLLFLKIKVNVINKIIFLLAYWLCGLSLIYYLFGITATTLSILLLCNFVFCLRIYWLGLADKIKINFKLKTLKIGIKGIEEWSLLAVLLGMICYFSSLNFLNGQSSPWPHNFIIVAVPFFLATFFLLKKALADKDNLLLTTLYFLLVIGVIAMSYVLSYGYDTLIHQATLQYIVKHGQMTPLTPFYVGQYVLEVLLNKFSGLSFVFLERWLTPVVTMGLLLMAGKYFGQRLHLQIVSMLVPISFIILLPGIFTYTSPYATALLWSILSLTYAFLFLKEQDKSDVVMALICAVVSCLIHPFVGLIIILWPICLLFGFDLRKQTHIQKIYLGIIFLLSSVGVVLAFVLYNWLKNNGLNIYNPVVFISSFARIFGEPIWYAKVGYPWWLGAVYFYEKINLFLIIFSAAYWPLSKFKIARDYLVLISFAALLAAWLFVASFKIDNYYYGDQVNYGYRLIQVAKWLLWPVVLLLLSNYFVFLKKVARHWQCLFLVFLSVLITTSWYLSYPRLDSISRMNVSSVRASDYDVVKQIYKIETSKKGYVVLSNQLIGAAAIVKYGFGPYYKYKGENLFYYSLPWGGMLSSIYNEMMIADVKNIEQEIQKVKKIIIPLGMHKFYFVYTDAWLPQPGVIKKLDKISTKHWNVGKKAYIYLFSF